MLTKRKKRKLSFKIEIHIEEDQGGFHAYCPSLKGMHIDGNTETEALDNAKKAVILYIESLIKHGDPIPLDAIEKDQDTVSTKESYHHPPQKYTEKILVAI